MAWSGTGTFSRIVTTVSPATGGTTIDSADMNTYTTDTASGINACLAKNGENAATGDLDLGSNKITALADGTADTDAATVVQAKNATHANNSNGNPNVSDTLFDPTSFSAGSFSSVGPTGSGATNTWAALDSVPAGVDWIEVKVFIDASIASGTACNAALYARINGGTDTNGTDNEIANIYTKGATGALEAATVTHAKIPVDSNVIFELLWLETGSALIDVYLTGYGYN